MEIPEREAILRLAADHGAHDVRVFGSFARGEAGPESDFDVLVSMEPGQSLRRQILAEAVPL